MGKSLFPFFDNFYSIVLLHIRVNCLPHLQESTKKTIKRDLHLHSVDHESEAKKRNPPLSSIEQDRYAMAT